MNPACLAELSQILRDPRVLDLPQSRRWLYLSLLAAAAGNHTPGVITARQLRSDAFIRERLGTNGYRLERALPALCDADMDPQPLVVAHEDGSLELTELTRPEGLTAERAAAPAPAPRGQSRTTLWRHRKQAAHGSNGHTNGHAPGLDFSGAPAVSSGDAAVSFSSPEGVSPSVPTDVSDVPSPAPNETPGRVSPETPLARVGNVHVNVSGEEDHKVISDSEDVETLNVNVETPAPRNVPNGTPPPFRRRPVFPDPPPSPPEDGGRRSGVPEARVPIQRREDVGTVVALTGDTESRQRWNQIWNHCQRNRLLWCWDEAVAVFLRRKEAGNLPPPEKWGASMNVTLQNICRDAGAPIPAPENAEKAEAQSALQDLRQKWATDEAEVPA